MEERNVTVDRDNGGSLAAFSLVAVLVVVALIGLFVWQPWNGTSTTRSVTTTTQPGTAGNTTGSNSGTTSNSSTTTTTTNGGGTQ